jgi:hypothetical protein
MRTTEFVCESSELTVLRRLYDRARCVQFDDNTDDVEGGSTWNRSAQFAAFCPALEELDL